MSVWQCECVACVCNVSNLIQLVICGRVAIIILETWWSWVHVLSEAAQVFEALSTLVLPCSLRSYTVYISMCIYIATDLDQTAVEAAPGAEVGDDD